MAKRPMTPNPAPNAARPATPAATTQQAMPNPAPMSSAVRNTAIPKAQPAPAKGNTGARREVTHDMIARRAYEISQSPQCGSEFDNWCRAERELRGQ